MYGLFTKLYFRGTPQTCDDERCVFAKLCMVWCYDVTRVIWLLWIAIQMFVMCIIYICIQLNLCIFAVILLKIIYKPTITMFLMHMPTHNMATLHTNYVDYSFNNLATLVDWKVYNLATIVHSTNFSCDIDSLSTSMQEHEIIDNYVLWDKWHRNCLMFFRFCTLTALCVVHLI